MAINFPNNPLDGNTYTYEGVKYTFKDTGSGGYWYLKDLGTATAATTADVNAGTDNTKYVTSDSLSGSTYDTRITSNANSITSLSNSKANTSGTYSGLRAQATTKADVGLGNVNNYGVSNSWNGTSGGVYATEYAVGQSYRASRLEWSGVLTTAYLNNFDAVIDYALPVPYVMVGFYSYHNNNSEDRRWRVKYRRLDQPF